MSQKSWMGGGEPAVAGGTRASLGRFRARPAQWGGYAATFQWVTWWNRTRNGVAYQGQALPLRLNHDFGHQDRCPALRSVESKHDQGLMVSHSRVTVGANDSSSVLNSVRLYHKDFGSRVLTSALDSL